MEVFAMKQFTLSISLNLRVFDETQVPVIEKCLRQLSELIAQSDCVQTTFSEKHPEVESTNIVSYMRQELLKDKVSDGTLKNRKTTIDWMEKCYPALSFEQLNMNFVNDFAGQLESHGLSANTVAKHVGHLRLYLLRAARAKLIGNEWLDGSLYIRKRQPYKHSYLSSEELQRLEAMPLNRLGRQSKIIVRAFLFCCYSGLRFSDVVRLSREHLSYTENNLWLRIRMKKTGNTIQIPLTSLFNQKGALILKESEQEQLSDNSRFFPIHDASYANKVMKQVTASLGITKHVSFHTSRHTFATECLAHHISMEVIQILLGHQSIRTTQVYAEMSWHTLVQTLQQVCW